ncbi:MAG: muconate cycloisomerase [Thermoprotei archaeon]|nr:MAG: muconate cycloisomerase [Thermoprotei archaeon]
MVRIREVEVIPLRIPFTRPFKISRGYVGAPGRPGEHVYLKVVTSDGEVGWGEARPMPSWMYETMESVYTTLKKYLSEVLIGEDPYSIIKIHRKMDKIIAPAVTSGQPFAKSAVDIALHDLIGKLMGVPIHKILGGKVHDYVDMSAIISGSPDTIADYAKEMWRRGYRCFKLKIMGDVEEDYLLIKTLNETIPQGLIWLDANQAYTSYSLHLLLKRISAVENIICIEQPVPTYDFHGLSRIVRKSPIPIAVDESLFSHYDLIKLISMNALDILVLKVAKSGIRTSMKIYALAEAAGLSCMGSGMTESGVGFTAALHVFSTMDLIAPADINGPQFLEDMLVKGLVIEGAKAMVPNSPGLGVEVDERKLEEYRVEVKI